MRQSRSKTGINEYSIFWKLRRLLAFCKFASGSKKLSRTVCDESIVTSMASNELCWFTPYVYTDERNLSIPSSSQLILVKELKKREA